MLLDGSDKTDETVIEPLPKIRLSGAIMEKKPWQMCRFLNRIIEETTYIGEENGQCFHRLTGHSLTTGNTKLQLTIGEPHFSVIGS